jgi:hypothetical protein
MSSITDVQAPVVIPREQRQHPKHVPHAPRRVPVPVIRYAYEEQILALIGGIQGLRDLCLMYIGIFCGPGASEVFGLQWKSWTGAALIPRGTALAVSTSRPGLPSAYVLCNSEYSLICRGVPVARPKSEDKRNAILDAATRVFAERGLTAAPTSEISKEAGVAEGTLFTYFKTKDDLMNALYREIKLELADAMMSGFPRKKSVRTRLQHVCGMAT